MTRSADIEGRLASAIAEHRAGRQTAALKHYQWVVACAPNHSQAVHLFGIALAEVGQPEAAVRQLRHAADLTPEHPAVWTHLGHALLKTGAAAAAAAAYSTARRLAPSDLAPLVGVAQSLELLGNQGQALPLAQAALRMAPDDVKVRHLVGRLLTECGWPGEGASLLRAVLEVQPARRDAHRDLAKALQASSRPEAAAAALEAGMTACPDDPEIYHAAGSAHLLDGRYQKALQTFASGVKATGGRDARLSAALALAGPTVATSEAELDEAWGRAVAMLATPPGTLNPTGADIGLTPFYLAYQGRDVRELNLAAAERARQMSGVSGFPQRSEPRPPQSDCRRRVAFVSRHLGSHTIGKLTAGFVEQFDRTRFHVSAVAIGASGSDPAAVAIAGAADAYAFPAATVQAVLEAFAGLSPDIIVYPDIGLDPLTYTLSLARLAPIQTTTWGHPVTTGMPWSIDAFISSRLIEERGSPQAHYAERLVLLDRLPAYYHRPPAPKPITRAELGLPSEGALYACPQTLIKLQPRFDRVLQAILQRDPTGRLVLLSSGRPALDRRLMNRLTQVMPAEIDRVLMLPRLSTENFIGLHQLAAAVLDPFGFGSGNSAYEAFSVGAPIVTLPSTFMRGRVVLGCYRQMGWEALVAETEDSYIHLCLKLGRSPDFSEHCRQEILARAAVLYEDTTAVRQFENALDGIWDEKQRLAPSR